MAIIKNPSQRLVQLLMKDILNKTNQFTKEQYLLLAEVLEEIKDLREANLSLSSVGNNKEITDLFKKNPIQ